MASEEVTLRKSAISPKHNQSIDKNLANDFRRNRIFTARDRSLPKPSNILAKSRIYSLTSGDVLIKFSFSIEPIQFKRSHSQQREVLTALPSKLERQSTNINFQTRAPTFHTLTKDNDQKRTSDFRRTQVRFSKGFFPNKFSLFFIDLCIKSFYA